MKVEALYTGKLKEHTFNNHTERTGIYKDSTPGPLKLAKHEVVGNEIGDLKHHGGEFKAVYCYTFEAYDFWKQQKGYESTPLGFFGENILISGFDEKNVCIGDQFKMGTALLEATGPRIPCNTLAAKYGDTKIIKDFFEARRMGIYFAVLEEGEVVVGDSVTLVKSHPSKVAVYDLVEAQLASPKDRPPILDRLDRAERLDPSWVKHIAQWRA